MFEQVFLVAFRTLSPGRASESSQCYVCFSFCVASGGRESGFVSYLGLHPLPSVSNHYLKQGKVKGLFYT